MSKDRLGLTRAERRERRHKPTMKVSGAAVKKLQRIIIERRKRKAL
jgi:hypothetical protein